MKSTLKSDPKKAKSFARLANLSIVATCIGGGLICAGGLAITANKIKGKQPELTELEFAHQRYVNDQTLENQFDYLNGSITKEECDKNIEQAKDFEYYLNHVVSEEKRNEYLSTKNDLSKFDIGKGLCVVGVATMLGSAIPYAILENKASKFRPKEKDYIEKPLEI